MATILIILYVLIGVLFGIRWHLIAASHTNKHFSNNDRMSCWCTTIWGDFFLLGSYCAPLLWPLMLLGIGCTKLLKIIRSIRAQTPNTITSSNMSAALLHKTLRHLIKVAETHTAVCPYKEESILPMINFSKEILNSDIGTNAAKLFGNLENNLMVAKSDFNILLKLVKNTTDAAKNDATVSRNLLNALNDLALYMSNHCLCVTGIECVKHIKHIGGTNEPKL